MIIGYARVSTFDQNLDRQIHSLTNMDVKKSSKKNSLEQFEKDKVLQNCLM